MNELRWILLGAGAILIAGLYIWGMRSRQRSAAPPLERAVRVEPPPPPAAMPAPEPARIEPSFSGAEEPVVGTEAGEPTVDFDEPAIARAQLRREPSLGPDTEPAMRTRTVLVIEPEPPPEPEPAREPEPAAATARPQQKIVAIRVVATPPLRFEGAKLLEVLRSEGLEFGRYDIFHNLHSDGRPIFSLASLREPGTFDLGTMPGALYPGVALFAVLPGPLPAVETFDQLIFTARAVAAQMNGTLADERGAPLTVHRITRLREDMVAFERQRTAGGAG